MIQPLQHQRDQCETSPSLVAGDSELLDQGPDAGLRTIPDESTGALQDATATELVHFGPDLVGTATEACSEAVHVEDRLGIAMEEYEDVPREQRPHVAIDETGERLA